MAEAVEVMKRAFASHSAGEVEMPLRTHVPAKKHKGTTLVMPAALDCEGWMGVKIVSVFNDNPARGLPRIQALVTLIDATSGTPRAVLEGASLTALRTGAASGAATDLLARNDSKTLAIIGAGVQGRTQLEAVCAVRRIRRVLVLDVDGAVAERFAREMGQQLGVEMSLVPSASEAVREADVVCTATDSPHPVLEDADVRPGTHINAAGGFQPAVQEIPSETVRRARVVVDHRASCLAEAGDLIVPIKEGLFGEDHIHAELGEVVSGLRAGRESDDEITLFKSVGLAVQDVAAAARILTNAQRLGLGTKICF
jgi:alanine dehydrogenase